MDEEGNSTTAPTRAILPQKSIAVNFRITDSRLQFCFLDCSNLDAAAMEEGREALCRCAEAVAVPLQKSTRDEGRRRKSRPLTPPGGYSQNPLGGM